MSKKDIAILTAASTFAGFCFTLALIGIGFKAVAAVCGAVAIVGIILSLMFITFYYMGLFDDNSETAHNN